MKIYTEIAVIFATLLATYVNGYPGGTTSPPADPSPLANVPVPITTPIDTQATPNNSQAPIANEGLNEMIKPLLAQTLSVQDILNLFMRVPDPEKFKLLESLSVLSAFSEGTESMKKTIDTAIGFMKNYVGSTNAFGTFIPRIGNYMSGLINANPIRNAGDQLLSAGFNGMANKIDSLNRYGRVATDFLGDSVRFGRNLANPLLGILPFGTGKAIANRMNNTQMNLDSMDELVNNTNQNLVGELKKFADQNDRRTNERRLLATESAQQ